MWLNILHKLLGKPQQLTRQDIDSYLDETLSNEARHRIERKLEASSFDQEAMEGYDTMGARTSDLKKLDKKFNQGFQYSSYLLVAAIILIITLPLTLYIVQSNETISQNELITATPTPHSHFIEKEDIELNQHIDSLTERKTELISKTELMAVPKHESSGRNKDATEEDIYIEQMALPTEKVKIESELGAEPMRYYAKEIYLYDFKFIDFRGDRLKPIKTRGVDFTGTSAEYELDNNQKKSIDWEDKEFTYHEYLEKTAVLLKSGSYKKALQRLETILNHYPSDENGLFYAGLCYYNLGHYQKAISMWTESKSAFRQNFYEESMWYTLKAYVALGETKKARAIAQQIVSEKGFYRNQALDFLEKN